MAPRVSSSENQASLAKLQYKCLICDRFQTGEFLTTDMCGNYHCSGAAAAPVSLAESGRGGCPVIMSYQRQRNCESRRKGRRVMNLRQANLEPRRKGSLVVEQCHVMRLYFSPSTEPMSLVLSYFGSTIFLFFRRCAQQPESSAIQ